MSSVLATVVLRWALAILFAHLSAVASGLALLANFTLSPCVNTLFKKIEIVTFPIFKVIFLFFFQRVIQAIQK